MKAFPFFIRQARNAGDFEASRKLLETYGRLRGYDKALGDFQSELAKLPGDYSLLLLAHNREGESVGCVAIKKLGPGICEMKRLFVLPAYQGKGIGKALSEQIIKEASKNFDFIRLDTHPSMKKAQILYKALGFYEIPRYNDNPTPGIRFFEKKLRN